jgi:hypothetical protein
VVSGAPFSGITGRLSNPNKSAFQAEGKMNKASSCTAASKESGKMANVGGRSALGRNSTELRFGALSGGKIDLLRRRRTTSTRALRTFRSPKLKTTGRALPVVLEV